MNLKQSQSEAKYLKLRLKKSLIGYPRDQKATAKALGLTRINRIVVKPNNPSIRGMVRKIQHLLEVEELAG